jgi:hypothetical protein
VTEFIPRPLWPEGCKPTSLVKLGEKRIGIRMTLASGERMTMPLSDATFKMLRWRKPR